MFRARNLRKVFHRPKKNVFAANKYTCNIEVPRRMPYWARLLTDM